MSGEIFEMGCGCCKHYRHIPAQNRGRPAGGLCEDKLCPHYGYIGRYGELVEFCDRMHPDADVIG